MKKKISRATLHEMWIVQPYQHGCIDGCEAPNAYATEDEAMSAAKEWASDIPWNSYEHECVVFKAVATFRGKIHVQKFEPALIHPLQESK